MYGYSDEDWCVDIGRSATASPSYAPAFLRAVAAGESVHMEVTEHRKDGSALELEVHGIPMQYRGQDLMC